MELELKLSQDGKDVSKIDQPVTSKTACKTNKTERVNAAEDRIEEVRSVRQFEVSNTIM